MSENVKYHGDVIIKDKHGKALHAITRGQQALLEVMDDNDIVFVNGPAGTGKTVVATWYGIAGIDDGLYDNLVLTRPIVGAGEDLGFLPGTFEEKVAPYMQPLYDAIETVKGKRITADMAATIEAKQPPVLSRYRKKKVGKGEMEHPKPRQKIAANEDFYSKVTVCPLAYLRGSTKTKSFIILDECQNVTKAQMKLMLTRLGHGSKLILCGDINQSDLERKSDSGFRHAQQILKGVRGIGFVTLGVDDIVRHRLIKDIIIRYEYQNNDQKSQVIDNRDYLDDEYDYEDDDDGLDREYDPSNDDYVGPDGEHPESEPHDSRSHER